MTRRSVSRILLVSPSFFSVGGVQRLMRAVVAHSAHRFDVLVRRRECVSGKVQQFEAETQGVRVVPVRVAGGRYHLRIAACLLRRRYRAVYLSSLRYADAALLPALAGVRVVCHAHGSDVFEDAGLDPVTRRAHAWGRSCISEVIAVSDWTGRQVERLGTGAARVTVVPNGVDPARFRAGEAACDARRDALGLSSSDFAVLTVARLVPRKGHRLVIEALRRLENVIYVIAGKGPEAEALRRAARAAGVAGRVRFAGFVAEEALPSYYRACDAYVMPSEHLEDAGSVEGFGLTFLEANASGRAVVGTRAGGIPTAIRHEHNGLLCAPTSEAVAGAIARLAGDDALREQIERRATRWAETHDWSRVAARIDRVLAGGEARPASEDARPTTPQPPEA